MPGSPARGLGFYRTLTVHRRSLRPGEFVTVGCQSLDEAALTRAHARARDGTLLLAGIDGLSPGLRPTVLGLWHRRDVRLLATAEALPAKELGRPGVSCLFPPLALHRDDLPLLWERLSLRLGRASAPNQEAWRLLWQHAWPGNVAELADVVRRALAASPGESIGAAAISFRSHARLSA